jgi:hypothetical protein
LDVLDDGDVEFGYDYANGSGHQRRIKAHDEFWNEELQTTPVEQTAHFAIEPDNDYSASDTAPTNANAVANTTPDIGLEYALARVDEPPTPTIIRTPIINNTQSEVAFLVDDDDGAWFDEEDEPAEELVDATEVDSSWSPSPASPSQPPEPTEPQTVEPDGHQSVPEDTIELDDEQQDADEI